MSVIILKCLENVMQEFVWSAANNALGYYFNLIFSMSLFSG